MVIRGLTRWLDVLRRDAAYSLRSLRQAPVFCAAVIVILGLAIGANTAVFTIVQSLLLRPLPYPEPARLGEVVTTYQLRGRSGMEDTHDGEEWRTIDRQVGTMELAAYSGQSTGANLVRDDAVRYVHQQRVSAAFFRVLAVEPMVGRGFGPADDLAEGPAVVVLAYDLWKTAFARDPSIVGSIVILQGRPHTVVGVMPASFRTGAAADLWTPLRPVLGEQSGQNYQIVGRLRPGATWAETEARFSAISGTALGHYHGSPTSRLAVIPLQRGLTDSVRTPLLFVWAAVGLVLFVGCLNVAGLLLARGAARRRELATRFALGATRTAVVHQLFVESTILVCAGGTLGVLLARLGIRAVDVVAGEALRPWPAVALDGRVLGLTLLVTVLTSVVSGLVPAWQTAGIDPRAMWMGSGGLTVTRQSRGWTRRGLVVGEIAVSAMLLIAAALLLRTFVHLRQQPPGFDPAHLTTATVALQDARYVTAGRVNRLFDGTLARIRALPGVEAAAIAASMPYQRALNMGFRAIDWPSDSQKGNMTTVSYVTAGYFEAARVAVRAGRSIADRDRAESATVVVVNVTFVKRYFGGQDPLGHHLRIAGASRTIVGVADDVPQVGWSPSAGPLVALPAVYIPAAQTSDAFFEMAHAWLSPRWLIRSTLPAGVLSADLQRALTATDPKLIFADVQTAEGLRTIALVDQRVEALVLSVFAALGLLLAAVALYGLMAGAIGERTREFGVRLALGATPRGLVLMMVGQGVQLGLVGALIGLAGALMCVRMMTALLFGVSPTDAATFAAVLATLLMVMVLASYLSSARAASVEPIDALRRD